MIVDVSLRSSVRLTRYHRGEHHLRLCRSTTIGWSQPFVDRGNEDGGLEADREFVEAASHRPVPLQAGDSGSQKAATGTAHPDTGHSDAVQDGAN